MKSILAVLAAAMLLGGCASKIATDRGWVQIDRGKTMVPLKNATPYVLRGEITEDGKPWTTFQIRKTIAAGDSVVIPLSLDREYTFKGEAFAGEDPVGHFWKHFATTNITPNERARAIHIEPVVIDDVRGTKLPPLSGVIVNLERDTEYVRVYHPQFLDEYVDIPYLESRFMTVVASRGVPVIWIQEYHYYDGRLVVVKSEDYLNPSLRGRIFHEGRRLDFRRRL